MTSSLLSTDKTKAAVITGHHSFDVPGFYGLFRSIPDIDFYMQSLDDFSADAGRVRHEYDVLLFYNYHQETPGGDTQWWEGKQAEVLQALGETSQGVFVMHHALLAFPGWPLWSDLVGIEERAFGYDDGQMVRIEVANPGHPIT